jgi:hypothetical protein
MPASPCNAEGVVHGQESKLSLVATAPWHGKLLDEKELQLEGEGAAEALMGRNA